MRTEYELGELLEYEQPTKYAVESTKYDDKYSTPVLTAGKSFILGYTNETEGIYDNLPVIIFDDFTTATQYVNFKFKVKSSAMKILKADEELALTKYLYYLMQTIHCDHDTHKRYWIQTYSKIKVAIPDITEQQRIVTKIEELFSKLDKGVEELNKIKEQLKIYRQAVLKEAFESDNTWIDCVIGDVITVLTDYHANGSYEILKENVELLNEPNYAIMVRSTNFEKNDFTNDVKYIDKKAYDFLKKSQLLGDEILIGKIGNAGKIYLMKKLGRPASLAMNMFAIRFNESINRLFAYYFLISNEAENDIKTYVKGVGTPTIDKKSVRSIRFRYPDILKQKEIVKNIEEKLSVCDKIEQTVNESLQKAESLRQSILKQAFEGKLV